MLYGYVRVSTEKQTVENQKLSIANYIKNKNRNNTNVERVSETLLFDMFGFAACRTTDK
jgi:DNA invertase Pin-like site-specific DNA recombinase